MTKQISFLILLLIPCSMLSAKQTAQWVKIAADKADTVYLDTHSINHNQDLANAWIKLTGTKNRQGRLSWQGQILAKVHVKCKTQKVAYQHSITQNAKGAVIKEGKMPTEQLKWKTIPKNSMISQVSKKICD